MSSAVELAVLRKQTKSFIDENPISILLLRTVKSSDGAGGTTSAPADPAVDPQTFRKIIQTKGNDARDIDNERVRPEFVLIGLFDADIKSGDRFMLNAIKYKVEYVRDDRRYETWAEVVLDG